MPIRFSRVFLFLSSLLLLSACGEGWEMKLDNAVFPYGNSRTAGSGVVYVRAKLLPEKALNLEVESAVEQSSESANANIVEVVESPEVEELFMDAQKK